MGLADRYYMREEYHASRLTTKLIVTLIVAFVIESILLFYFKIDILTPLGLTVDGLQHGKVWQLFTFQFLHTAPWPFHVLFNCLGLYFFGRPIEERLGPKKFLVLYLLSGIAGGLLQATTTAVLPQHEDFPVVGASAGVCGMIAVFCSLYPMQELTTWIYFFPVTVRAKYFLMFLALFSLYGTIIPFGNVAYAAHLGGILLGISYVRWGDRVEGVWDWNPFKSWRRKDRSARPSLAKTSRWKRSRPSDPSELPSEEFISREVDPILDKISAHGIQSLTEEERRILEAARNKMAKR